MGAHADDHGHAHGDDHHAHEEDHSVCIKVGIMFVFVVGVLYLLAV